MAREPRRVGNVIALKVTFDYHRKQIVFSVRLGRKMDLETIRDRAGQLGLLNPNGFAYLVLHRTMTGRIEFTFSGEAIKHIFRALPLLGAPTTIAGADARRKELDRQMKTRTSLFVDDLGKMVILLCNATD